MGQSEITDLLSIGPMTVSEMHSHGGYSIRSMHNSLKGLIKRKLVGYEIVKAEHGNMRPVRKFFLTTAV